MTGAQYANTGHSKPLPYGDTWTLKQTEQKEYYIENASGRWHSATDMLPLRPEIASGQVLDRASSTESLASSAQSKPEAEVANFNLEMYTSQGKPNVWNKKTASSRTLSREESGGCEDYKVVKNKDGKEFVVSPSMQCSPQSEDDLFPSAVAAADSCTCMRTLSDRMRIMCIFFRGAVRCLRSLYIYMCGNV